LQLDNQTRLPRYVKKNTFLHIKLPEGGGSGDAQVNAFSDFDPT
jgi:hypothetical protein